jgi:dolichol-phosphate mannosyltransferase
LLEGLIKRLSSEGLRRFIKFAVVGASGVLVNMGVFALCAEIAFSDLSGELRNVLAGIVGVVVSILSNFLLNDAWTWRDRRREGSRHFLTRMGKYYVVAGIAGTVQIGVLYALSGPMDLNAYLSNFAGIVAGVLINFFVNNLWTFRADGSTLPDKTPGEPLETPGRTEGAQRT